jgi:hypothetical protein
LGAEASEPGAIPALPDTRREHAAVHPDPRVQAVVEQSREAEMIQAIRLSTRAMTMFAPSYGGKGGILLDSFWKKILFAWTQKDINIPFDLLPHAGEPHPDLADG